jgi:mRNA interferase MazF
VHQLDAGPGGPPKRGDIWLVNLSPTVGREQYGTRPAVIVSADRLNQSLAEVVIVVPMTRTNRGIPWHVQVTPSDGDVRETSYIKCEDVRSISVERLVRRWGTLSSETMSNVASTIRVLLQL